MPGFALLHPEYPWLRGHGSIEAASLLGLSLSSLCVSMAERSWLH